MQYVNVVKERGVIAIIKEVDLILIADEYKLATV